VDRGPRAPRRWHRRRPPDRRRGADTLVGGDVADTLDGGPWPDVFAGGPDKDTVSYASRTDGLGASIDGNANHGSPTDDRGGVGDNVGLDVENLIGGKGNDDLSGSAGPNVLQGGPGNDDLSGGDGNDVLDDRQGKNWFEGGGGDDLLRQGPIANAGDVLHGGDGTDTVSYQRRTAPVSFASARPAATATRSAARTTTSARTWRT